ncbi:hypothetical protein Y032_0010g1049 [Ancylostoma ceylanicum]|uniref:Uncharacterized protein n=1 Tax=Ancylostoma ceylanicum TaxID=53326 RepID=A0A016VGV1_9BILA|nr:hypothetical protein Y032_0010g1049 [Ancylostoma ceylanicum]
MGISTLFIERIGNRSATMSRRLQRLSESRFIGMRANRGSLPWNMGSNWLVWAMLPCHGHYFPASQSQERLIRSGKGPSTMSFLDCLLCSGTEPI